MSSETVWTVGNSNEPSWREGGNNRWKWNIKMCSISTYSSRSIVHFSRTCSVLLGAYFFWGCSTSRSDWLRLLEGPVWSREQDWREAEVSIHWLISYSGSSFYLTPSVWAGNSLFGCFPHRLHLPAQKPSNIMLKRKLKNLEVLGMQISKETLYGWYQ